MRTATLTLTLLTMLVTPVLAHDYWMERAGAALRVVYGHGASRESYDPAEVKDPRGWDPAGRPVAVKLTVKDGAAWVTPSDAVLVTVTVDGGYWTKTVDGWKRGPKQAGQRYIDSTRSLFYAKAVLTDSPAAHRPVGQPLEIVPTGALKLGTRLTLKVLLGGKALPGATLEGGRHDPVSDTDAQGTASVELKHRGTHVFTVRLKERANNDPQADNRTQTAVLSFEVP